MKTVQTLIAMARAKVHTDRELAQRIGETPQNLAHMKAGRRAVSPETVAALCEVLQLTGEECREWIAIAIIENPKNASKVDWLKRALFACWVLGVGTLITQPTDAPARTAEAGTRPIDTSSSYVSVTDPIHIVALLLRLTQRVRSTVKLIIGGLPRYPPRCRILPHDGSEYGLAGGS